MAAKNVKHTLSLILVLFAIWLLWSGIYTPLLVTFGALSCLAVVGVARRMRVVDAEGAPFDRLFRAVAYAPWLLWQIVKANVDVARRILDPRLPVAPRVVRVPVGQRTDLGRVVHANSITLTPGTVSIGVAPDTITVHALTREAAEEVLAGAIDARVRRFEGRALSAIFATAMVAILVTMGLALTRASLGPTVFDRILALNMFGTKTVLLIAVSGFLTGRPDFLDLALVYALMNFIGVIAVLRFSKHGHFGESDERPDEEGEAP